MNNTVKIVSIVGSALALGLTSSAMIDSPPLTTKNSHEIQLIRPLKNEKVTDTAVSTNNPVTGGNESPTEKSETFLTENEIVFAKIIDKLYRESVDSSFVDRIINHPNTKFNDKFVKINVTGYLKKPDYSSHYNKRSVAKSKKFLAENNVILHKAEDEYGVPAEAITAILWVETRHGGYTGKNQLPSVYLSTAMANESEYLALNVAEIEKEHKKGSKEYNKLQRKVLKRAKRKSKWALDQLVAMSKIEDMLPNPVTEIEGSWAGAFGWAQFLPSSYQSWAVDGNGDGVIDLFDKEDAVFSVANYLKKHGWSKSKKSHRKAVYGYNHSNDYVDAVLKLADRIK